MKKCTLFLKYSLCLLGLLLLRATSAQAALIPEATAFPDANFRNYVKTTYPTCFSGGFFDDACTRVANETNLDVSRRDIANLEGLQYFKKITNLQCGNNSLTSLPTLPSTLQYLNCENNKISVLPAFPEGLLEFNCYLNQVRALPALPKSLLVLICNNNQITTGLTSLPNGLKYLNCAVNFLVSLPELPNSIESMYCPYNRLKNLPTLPTRLNNLSCEFNELSALPILPNGLKRLDCFTNVLESLPALPESLEDLFCERNLLTSFPALPKNLKTLRCYNNQLTSLPDLSKSSVLKGRLLVYNNQIPFEDILPNIDKFASPSDYSPQFVGISPTSQSLFFGGTLFMSAAVKGSGNTYQWFRNNAAIAGATLPTYTKTRFTSADAGTYRCEVSNAAVPTMKIVSNNVNVFIAGNAIVILSPKSTDFLQYNTYHTIALTTNILDPVKVELLGMSQPLLLTELPASTAAFKWYVPKFVPKGSAYKIRVSSLGNSDIIEESEAFSIGVESPETRIVNNFPASINDKSPTPLPISVEVGKSLQGIQVFCYYKKIAERRENFKTIAVTPSPTNPALFSSQIPLSLFDKVGVEYYFEFRRNGLVQASSLIGRTTIKYPNLEIPYTNFGKGAENYEMIAIPLKLSQNTVADVFKDELGAYNIKTWRTFAYRNGSTNEFAGGTVNAGEGFWLLIKDKPEMPLMTGEGTTIPTSTELEGMHSVPVKKGWNQIGNPYLFPLDFGNLQRANQNLKVNTLQTFEKGIFVGSTQLKPFQGGFVFVENEGDLKFPPSLFDPNSGGRTEENEFDLANAWQVSLNLLSSDFPLTQKVNLVPSLSQIRQTKISGFGMHPKASTSKDDFDVLTPPRFLEHLEVNFMHNEYFYPYFSKDIVPTQDSYVWEFSVESGTDGNYKTLSWEKIDSKNDKGLILFDVEKNIKIDMSKEIIYTFALGSGKKNFKIYFGNEQFLKENILPENASMVAYPNPFTDNLKFSISLPEKSKAYLQLYNSLGQVVMSEEREFEAGFAVFSPSEGARGR